MTVLPPNLPILTWNTSELCSCLYSKLKLSSFELFSNQSVVILFLVNGSCDVVPSLSIVGGCGRVWRNPSDVWIKWTSNAMRLVLFDSVIVAVVLLVLEVDCSVVDVVDDDEEASPPPDDDEDDEAGTTTAFLMISSSFSGDNGSVMMEWTKQARAVLEWIRCLYCMRDAGWRRLY